MVKQLAPSSSHSAGGPFGGYMYQLEFALLSLFDLQPGECLGIETLDDVAKEGEEGQTRYQLKNQASGRRLTDSSPELWKTLGIWAQEIQNGITPLASLKHLILVTPAKVAPNSMVAEIARGEHCVNAEKTKRIATWLYTASPSSNQKVQWAFDAIRNLAHHNKADFDMFVRKLIIKSEQPALSGRTPLTGGGT